MHSPQKFELRDLYLRFAPTGPCIRLKSPISSICIRGLPHWGHVFAPKVRFPGFVFGVCPLGAMFSAQKSDFWVLYSGLPPWGPFSGRNFEFCFSLPKWPKMAPQGPGVPWGVFSAYFCPIFGPPRAPWGPPGGALGGPWGLPYFPYLRLLPY